MKYDIENRIKDTALINLVDFENAIDLYEDGEVEKALELMFGVTTLGLGGKFETDDKEIRRLLKNREYTAEKSNKAYCNKVKTEEEKRIEKLQLKEIADMLSNGVTQQVIADTLGVSLKTVEYRIKVMKAEFPNIYSASMKTLKTLKNPKKPQYNDNVNDNVNVKDNVKEKEKEKGKEKAEKPKNLNDNVNVNVNDNDNENNIDKGDFVASQQNPATPLATQVGSVRQVEAVGADKVITINCSDMRDSYYHLYKYLAKYQPTLASFVVNGLGCCRSNKERTDKAIEICNTYGYTVDFNDTAVAVANV